MGHDPFSHPLGTIILWWYQKRHGGSERWRRPSSVSMLSTQWRMTPCGRWDGKSRYVPILPELAQELRTHLGQRTVGYLFETNRATCYSPRRIQYVVKETAAQAEITKRVYPHLLRHSVATTLLERGMPIEQIQKFLGHAKLETTQVYAESSTAMLRESYQRALSNRSHVEGVP
jgi:site-specific recombinase XerD